MIIQFDTHICYGYNDIIMNMFDAIKPYKFPYRKVEVGKAGTLF